MATLRRGVNGIKVLESFSKQIVLWLSKRYSDLTPAPVNFKREVNTMTEKKRSFTAGRFAFGVDDLTESYTFICALGFFLVDVGSLTNGVPVISPVPKHPASFPWFVDITFKYVADVQSRESQNKI